LTSISTVTINYIFDITPQRYIFYDFDKNLHKIIPMQPGGNPIDRSTALHLPLIREIDG